MSIVLSFSFPEIEIEIERIVDSAANRMKSKHEQPLQSRDREVGG